MSSKSMLLPRPERIDDFLEAQRPMVIAHRGFSGRAPENTLTAVRLAMELGADMVEVDVTLTSDGFVVVFHDETLDRTTDGAGVVREKTFSEIRALDAGSWYHRRFAGEPVPTLGEVLDLVKGRILINVEIKPEAVDDEPRGGIAEKVAEEVGRRGMENEVIVSSFNPRVLAHLYHGAPEIRTASLYNRDLHGPLLPSEITAAAQSSAFNVSQMYLTSSMLADARTHDLPVSVYTVNWTWRMRYLLNRGVNAIFTDRPDRMLRLVEKRARIANRR